ncbi:MAG: hypothetical protein KatS3mg053_2642 [Candidatus Roseilinea sp.]|nr:MAG: hypothetical protein KatS3mg053_2642 [Candidatus Roseilinea sp.]
MNTRNRLVRVAGVLSIAVLVVGAAWTAPPRIAAQAPMNAPSGLPPFPPKPPKPPPPAPRAVSLKKTAEVKPNLGPGDAFDYELTVHNNTDNVAQAVLSDTLPAETELVGTPLVVVITPSADPLTTTFDPTIGPRGTVRWEGTLSAGAKIKVVIKVKLLNCPQPGQLPFIGWDRSVKNVATLQVGNGRSVATYAFVPGGCRGNPPPSPKPEPTPVPGADIGVRKLARLHADRDLPERGWQASWLVTYGNRGDQTAQNVRVVDTPSGNQTLTFVQSAPPITPTREGDSFVFPVGDLPSLKGGAIMLRTAISFSAPAGTVLTNAVSITATNDVSLTNNSAVVTLTLLHLPPIITYPVSGATCTGTITITGKAQGGSPVAIYVGDAQLGSTTADANGNWSFAVNLEEGFHVIQAETKDANGNPKRSKPVLLKVDPSLTWDPISLKFIGPGGNVRHHPRHWSGWFDDWGWYVRLAPSTTYTVSVRVCCTDPTAAVTLTVPGSGVVTLADPDGDRTFTGVFTTGDVRSMVRELMKLCVTCDGETNCAFGRIVPIPARARDHVVVITAEGFSPSRLRVRPGEVIEFINMDETARSIGTAPNLPNMPAGELQTQNFDAVYLDVGESHIVEVNGATTYYDMQNGEYSVSISVGGVYLPIVRR